MNEWMNEWVNEWKLYLHTIKKNGEESFQMQMKFFFFNDIPPNEPLLQASSSPVPCENTNMV